MFGSEAGPNGSEILEAPSGGSVGAPIGTARSRSAPPGGLSRRTNPNGCTRSVASVRTRHGPERGPERNRTDPKCTLRYVTYEQDFSGPNGHVWIRLGSEQSFSPEDPCGSEQIRRGPENVFFASVPFGSERNRHGSEQKRTDPDRAELGYCISDSNGTARIRSDPNKGYIPRKGLGKRKRRRGTVRRARGEGGV